MVRKIFTCIFGSFYTYSTLSTDIPFFKLFSPLNLPVFEFPPKVSSFSETPPPFTHTLQPGLRDVFYGWPESPVESSASIFSFACVSLTSHDITLLLFR